MFEITPYSNRGSLGAYNPFRIFDELEKNFFKGTELVEFKSDIKDIGDSFLIESDLPGFKKEDIQISMDDKYLTITAERHSDAEDKDKQGNYLRCERSYGLYKRVFNISAVNGDEITAEYKDGVLTLTLPKRKAEEPKVKTLEIQ